MKIVLAVNLDGLASAKDVQNAIRRAFNGATGTFEVGEKGESKGVSYFVAPSPSLVPLTNIREWAASNGYTLSARGRIPRKVTLAFEAAQAKPKRTAKKG